MKNYRLNGSRRYRFKNSDRKRNKDFNKINHDISSTITFPRRSVQGNNHNVSKLIDKYTTLAKEALSSGDKILSENYFQHADHFTRVLNDQDAQKKLNSTNNDVANSSQNIVDVKKDQNESDENKTITQIK